MEGTKRSNQGYEIIESCTIGNTELVIGHHPTAPNPYVCWYCKGGGNYYWGCYCNTLEAAREKLNDAISRNVIWHITSRPTERRSITMNVSGNEKKI